MIFLLVCLAILAASEFATVTILLAPLSQSTQTDWLIGTLFVAPYAAGWVLWLLGLATRVVATLHAGWRWITRKNTAEHRLRG